MSSRQMFTPPWLARSLALLIVCTKGDGFTLFEALNSKGDLRLNFNGFKIIFWWFIFDIYVTVHHWYNNINNQLDAKIINFIDNYNQINMFRVIISPISLLSLSSGALDCVYSLWYNAPAMLPAGDKDSCRQQAFPPSITPSRNRGYQFIR